MPDDPLWKVSDVTQTERLDVRDLAPAQRHEQIIDTALGLAEGEAFILVNDHDPKPLYYQFAAEYPDRFTWEYLESGPQVWTVRIGRSSGRADVH